MIASLSIYGLGSSLNGVWFESIYYDLNYS